MYFVFLYYFIIKIHFYFFVEFDIWALYGSHRITHSHLAIYMFSSFIVVGEIMHRHLSGCVLKKFGYEQPILRSPNVAPKVDLIIIDNYWLCFFEHVLVNFTTTSSSSACIEEYLWWFKRVSHPYFICVVEDDRPNFIPQLRQHLPYDIPIYRRSESKFGLLVCNQIMFMFLCCEIMLINLLLSALKNIIRYVVTIL